MRIISSGCRRIVIPVLDYRPKVTARVDSSELMHSVSQRKLTENQRIGIQAFSQDMKDTCLEGQVSSHLIIVSQGKGAPTAFES